MSRQETTPLLGHDHRSASTRSTWRAHLSEEVNVDDCGPALTAQCVVAGAADAAAYGQTGTWVAFMTGNLTQLTMSATTIGLTRPVPESSVDRVLLSGSSVLGFIAGAFVAMMLDLRYGSRTRGKLASMALVRCLVYAIVAGYVAWQAKQDDIWHGWSGSAAIALLAANMGSMAVNAQKAGNAPYATTIVFTATLAQLFSDPLLPYSASTASVKRAISILGLVAGACISQSIVILVTRMSRDGEQQSSVSAFADPSSQTSPFGSAYALVFVAAVEIVAVGLWLRVKPAAARS